MQNKADSTRSGSGPAHKDPLRLRKTRSGSERPVPVQKDPLRFRKTRSSSERAGSVRKDTFRFRRTRSEKDPFRFGTTRSGSEGPFPLQKAPDPVQKDPLWFRTTRSGSERPVPHEVRGPSTKATEAWGSFQAPTCRVQNPAISTRAHACTSDPRTSKSLHCLNYGGRPRVHAHTTAEVRRTKTNGREAWQPPDFSNEPWGFSENHCGAPRLQK